MMWWLRDQTGAEYDYTRVEMGPNEEMHRYLRMASSLIAREATHPRQIKEKITPMLAGLKDWLSRHSSHLEQVESVEQGYGSTLQQWYRCHGCGQVYLIKAVPSVDG